MLPVLVILGTIVLSTAQKQATCDTPIDLVFALDASGSVKEDGYRKTKDFANKLVDHFNIGISRTHVGVLIFSENAEIQFRLDSTFDKDEIHDKINKLPYPAYRTATDDALRVADSEMFSLDGGARQGVPQVLVIVNDGKCTVCAEPVGVAAAPLKAKGITIFTIGVTDSVKKEELLQIASRPPNKHYFQVDNFAALTSIITELQTRTCQVKRGKCPVPLPPFNCDRLSFDDCFGDDNCTGVEKCCNDGCRNKCVPPLLNCLTPIDIAFAFDSSSSVRDSSYALMKVFAQRVVDSFSISQKDARFASLIYGTDAEVNFSFVRYQTAEEIKRAIENLKHLKTNTRIDKALLLAKLELFSLQGQVRSRRPMVLLTFFDGTVNRRMPDLVEVSKPLKDYGVKIIAIGVGPEVNEFQMKRIAANNESIFTSNNFLDIMPQLYDVAIQSCNRKPGTCSVPTPTDPELCFDAVNECEDDFDCFGTSKCCKKGCAKKCEVKGEVCPRKVDVAFALHENMQLSEFETSKFFLGSAIDRFLIGEDKSHVAVLKFGNQPEVIFDFKSASKPHSELVKQVNSMRYTPGKGPISNALGLACDAVFCQRGGTRANVPKILVILTGETSRSDPNELRERIDTLQQRGVDVIIIGVGRNLDLQTLREVTGGADLSEDRVWLAQGYREAMQYVQDISDFACSEAGTLLPGIGKIDEKEGCGEQPKTCYKGPKGSMGRPGKVGERGDPGPIGEYGKTGIKGPKGAKGPDGSMGPKGIRGSIGLRGLPGFPGYDGIPGVPGVEGRTGFDGDCGLPGTSGGAGVPGLDGLPGSPGRAGNTGEKGTKGIPAPINPNLEILPGQRGDKGDTGPKGFKGTRGADGDKGIHGDDGHDGEQGLRGEMGEMGDTGTFINVKGRKGARGDVGPAGKYWEAGGTTDSEGVTSIIGDRGEPGATGPPGDIGEPSSESGLQGRQGKQGDAGPRGVQGEKGKLGEKGEIGDDGAEGLPGRIGEKGRQGRRGEKGILGDDGEDGEKGAKGAKGVEGDSIPGPDGEVGEDNFESGIPGQTGPPGRKGDPGEKGKVGRYLMGPPGDVGAVGERGPQGPNGVAGTPGMQGSTGRKGQKGLQGSLGEDGPNGELKPGKPGMRGPPGLDGSSGAPGNTGVAGPPGEPSIVKCVEGVCPIGRKGIRGAPGGAGKPGPEGNPGSDGPKGFQGGPCPLCPTGVQGYSGEIGLPGMPGDKGEKGSDGKIGGTGRKGEIGVRGGIGRIGDDGDQGARGDRGDPGETGESGPGVGVPRPGVKGIIGDTGRQGAKGNQGPAGTDGIRGISGSPGANGADGIQGEYGDDGSPGFDGRKGSSGPRGDPGINQRGTPGLQGNIGKEGKQGVEGDVGSDGPKGEEGSPPSEEEMAAMKNKMAGDQGSPGLRGQQGEPGLPGPVGPQGERGLKGSIGLPGLKGFGGLPGDRGKKGRVGDDGNPGYTGLPGKPGRRGMPGVNGKPGPQGLSPMGEKGPQGEAGIPGNPGVDAPPPEGCFTLGDPTDIAFLLDSSRSVTNEHFEQQKEFVKNILGEFPVSQDQTHAGIIKYGRTADIEISFNDFVTERDLFTALNDVKHSSEEESRLDFALEVARNQLFTRDHGARGGNTENAIVILGDGFMVADGTRSSVLNKRALKYAQDLKDAGITVFAIGVGPEKNTLLLEAIVSKKSYYISIESYSQLTGKIDELQVQFSAACITDGDPGQDGIPGTPGLPGSKGVKGQKGQSPRGLQGSKGVIGEKGDDGVAIRGIPGKEGLMGYPGADGLPGKDGKHVYGRPGKRGLPGDDGDSIRGPDGDVGLVGDPGYPGTNAAQLLCDHVQQTDLLFIMDSSGSVRESGFNKMKQFIKEIITPFDVDNQLTKVSVVNFADYANIAIAFGDYYTTAALFKAIDDIPYMSGESTRLDMALDFAYNAFFGKKGGRDGVGKAVVLMTDGQYSYVSANQPSLLEAIQPLKDKSVFRYAIGIGPEIDSTDLSDIADQNVVLAENYDDLLSKIEEQIDNIAKKGCQGPAGLPGRDGPKGVEGKPGLPGPDGLSPIGDPGPRGPKGRKGEQGIRAVNGRKGDKGSVGDRGPTGLPGCTTEAGELGEVPTDLAFVLDASASLYEEGFEKEKEFVKTVLRKIPPLSRKGIRVGVVVYSEEANIRIRFDYSFDRDEVITAIDNIPYDNKITRMDLGLQLSRELFSEQNGGRGSSKKVLIFMADGQQSYVPNIPDPSFYAEQLAEDGVDIFAIGIGAEIDKFELETLITKPEHIFLASDIKSLISDLSGDISAALICEGGPRGIDGETGGLGPRGDRGPAGPQGNAGLKGDRGDPGLGPKGDNGEPGPIGPKGYLGEKGYRGSSGPPGDIGARGPKGFRGRQGEQGAQGFRGLDGKLGPPGKPGPKGPPGDAFGQGGEGRKGEQGDVGRPGISGDRGSLPPGSVIKDLTGPRGGVGEVGGKGKVGKPGVLRVAPGKIGTEGEKGDGGDNGEFGDFGERGNEGPSGAAGLPGEKGDYGPSGYRGVLGKQGLIGEQGKLGEPGVGRKGVHGEDGDVGLAGEAGNKGETGLPGFEGMMGKKGDKGETGQPGKQQKPTLKGQPGPRGLLGEKGYKGDFGEQGPPGKPGYLIGSKGLSGEKGDIGRKGEQGSLGPDGEKGTVGLVGANGLVGPAGEIGEIGETGKPGEQGIIGETIGGSEKGEKGDEGLTGLTGRAGQKGKKGERGVTGQIGRKGFKGTLGSPGFAGIQGDRGVIGIRGNKGPLGPPGPPGEDGVPGPPGPNGIAEGFFIVRHSQSAVVPNCPRNYKFLWSGYSLMYTVGNGHAHAQDLGDAGSCSKSFSTLPFLFCSITGSCKYASRNDFVYWLAGEQRQPMMPVSNTAVNPFISRCVVCEAPSVHVAVHSQETSRPECPRGWDSLWNGYSFMMVAGAGKTGAGQSLSSSGSCLEVFRPKPFIECQGARGTCHFFSDKYSFWLTTIDKEKQFETQAPQTLSENKGDELTSRVSRCRVCIRRQESGNIIEPGNNFRRFARSVVNFFRGD